MLQRFPILNRLLSRGPREIMRGASIAFILRIVGLVLGFAFNVVLTRLLGPSEAGLYFLALSAVTIGSTIAMFGQHLTSVRFIASNMAVKQYDAVKGMFRMGVILAGTVSLIVSLLLYVGAPWLGNIVYEKPEFVAPFRIMTLGLLPLTLMTVISEMIKGLRRLRDSQLIQAVGQRGLPLVGVLLVGTTFGLEGVVATYAIAMLLLTLTGLVVWYVVTPFLRGVKPTYYWRDVLNSALPLFWIAPMQVSLNQMATFFLGVYAESADIAVFNVALRTAMLINILLVSVNSDVAPKFAAEYRLGNMKKLEHTAQSATRLIIMLAIPVVLVFIVGARWLMLIFGPQYVGGATLLIILSLGQFVNAATGSVSHILVMTGNERVQRNIIIASALVGVAANWLLVPRWGALGAAIATAIIISLTNLASAFAVYRILNIQMLPLLPSRQR